MQNVHLSIGEDAMCEDENGDTGFDNDLDISSDNESSAVVSEIDESETIEEISDVSFDVDDSSGLEEVPEISEIESMPEMVADEAIEEFDIDNYSSLEEVSEYIDETNDIDTLLDIRDALTGELLEDIEENAVNESEQFFSDENIHDEIIEEMANSFEGELSDLEENSEIDLTPESLESEITEEIDIDEFSPLEEVSEYINNTDDLEELRELRDILTEDFMEDTEANVETETEPLFINEEIYNEMLEENPEEKDNLENLISSGQISFGEDEEDINDGNGVKTLTREITPEIIDSRERDTEETLQNYRENLEERGVSSEQIDAFINEQRERIYDEYDSLDQGEATKNIYEMPQNWDEVAQNLNNSELYGNNIEYEETITEEQMDEDLSYVEGLPEVEESEERSEGNLELDNSSEAEETLGHEELDNMPENSDLREEPFVHDANEGIDITGDETSEDVEGVEDIPEIDYEEIYNQLNQEALNQGFEEINIYEDVERLDSLLNNFETEKWESISLPEQKHAIDELAHYVEDVIGFQNTPTIEYYNNPQEGDYGGYNVATNTLSINEYMLYNSEEAADTVAHELWHAHQRECADHPQNVRDYQYQYNFENYIRPEMGHELYENQLVEAEARAFAQQFKGRLASRR